MAKKMEEILDEIHQNAAADRIALSEVRDMIIKNFDQADPFSRTAAAECVARLTDSMSKINAQVMEIAKVKLKEHMAEMRAKERDNDPDSMFDEIGEFDRRDEEIEDKN